MSSLSDSSLCSLLMLICFYSLQTIHNINCVKKIMFTFHIVGVTSPWLSHSTWTWVGPRQALLEQGRLRPQRILAEPWVSWYTSSIVLNRWTTRCGIPYIRVIAIGQFMFSFRGFSKEIYFNAKFLWCLFLCLVHWKYLQGSGTDWSMGLLWWIQSYPRGCSVGCSGAG